MADQLDIAIFIIMDLEGGGVVTYEEKKKNEIENKIYKNTDDDS